MCVCVCVCVHACMHAVFYLKVRCFTLILIKARVLGYPISDIYIYHWCKREGGGSKDKKKKRILITRLFFYFIFLKNSERLREKVLERLREKAAAAAKVTLHDPLQLAVCVQGWAATRREPSCLCWLERDPPGDTGLSSAFGQSWCSVPSPTSQSTILNMVTSLLSCDTQHSSMKERMNRVIRTYLWRPAFVSQRERERHNQLGFI